MAAKLSVMASELIKCVSLRRVRIILKSLGVAFLLRKGESFKFFECDLGAEYVMTDRMPPRRRSCKRRPWSFSKEKKRELLFLKI